MRVQAVRRPCDDLLKGHRAPACPPHAKDEFPKDFRFKTISRYYVYHGTTLGTLAAGGMGDRKSKFEPFAGEFVHVPAPTCIAARLAWCPPSCGVACAKAIESAIQGEGPASGAEVIVEPIMCGVGVAVPPDECLPMVEEICRKYDAAARRRGDQRLRPHRKAVRTPALGVSPDIKGLLIGIELVTDRESKLLLDGKLIAGVPAFCRKNGVIVGRSGGGAALQTPSCCRRRSSSPVRNATR